MGVLLILIRSALINTREGLGGSTAWMFQAGLILLVGALAIFASKKRMTTKGFAIKVLEISSLTLMIILISLGFLNGTWSEHPLGFIIALGGGTWVLFRCFKKQESIQQKNAPISGGGLIYRVMFNNQIKLAVILAAVVIIIFGMSYFRAALGLQDPQQKPPEETQTASSNPVPILANLNNDVIVEPALTPEDKLKSQINKYFTQGISNQFGTDDLNTRITEIKIEDGKHGKLVTIKFNEGPKGPYSEMDVIYKAIFTYGDKIEKASIESYYSNFQDNYGNECSVLSDATKIDDQSTISKVNWDNISDNLVDNWWKETYIYSSKSHDTINCKNILSETQSPKI